MFGFRVLLFVVAYVVVIGEMLVGSTIQYPAHKIIWIIPGGLVLALLLATSFLLLPQMSEGNQPPQSSILHWVVLLFVGMAIAAASFYFPLTIMPLLKENM